MRMAPIVKAIPERKARSASSFIMFLRAMLDMAFDEEIVYMEITYKKATDKRTHTMSIVN